MGNAAAKRDGGAAAKNAAPASSSTPGSGSDSLSSDPIVESGVSGEADPADWLSTVGRPSTKLEAAAAEAAAETRSESKQASEEEAQLASRGKKRTTIDDFELLKVVGKGSFAKVLMVKCVEREGIHGVLAPKISPSVEGRPFPVARSPTERPHLENRSPTPVPEILKVQG